MRQREFELLMSALANRDRLDTLLEYDPMDMFTEPDSLVIFETLQELTADGIDPDLPTLAVRLKDHIPDRVAAITSELSRSLVTVNFEGLLSELKRRNARRRIQDLASDLCDTFKNGGTAEDAESIILEYQDKMIDPAHDLFMSMRDMAANSLDYTFSQHAATPTGIDAIDGFLPGLYGGQLIIIAARPGMGKTSLALQIAANMPATALFFSLEMSRQELFARRLSAVASVEEWQIETQKVNNDETSRILKAQDAIRQAENNLVIVDRLSDVNGILNTARRFIRRGNISAVFVDYLTLLTGGRGENQNLRVSDITRRLKSFATENSIPVLLLSQLNRAIEYHDRDPVLSDLRDSGAIEQDADVVIFIHETEETGSNLIIAKNRKGRIGKTTINFEKRFTRFAEAS